MPYASQADIVELYGANALVVADRNGDGVPDADAVARALDLSSGEMDTYIGRRYSLPLPALTISSAAHLTQLCVDIAIYRLALSQDVATTEHRVRYEDALSVLTKIADGRAALTLAPPAPGEEGAPEISGPSPIVVGGPERLFSRERMRDL